MFNAPTRYAPVKVFTVRVWYQRPGEPLRAVLRQAVGRTAREAFAQARRDVVASFPAGTVDVLGVTVIYK